MEKRNTLLAGASGLVGSALLDKLISDDRYDKIVLISRNPDISYTSEKIISQLIDFDDLIHLKTEIRIDDVYCALGTTIKTAGSQDAFRKVDFDYVVNLAKWSQNNGIQRFMVVSAMGSKASSAIFYNKIKGEMEDAVKLVQIPETHVFRPSLLLGNRKEKRTGEKIAQMVMTAIGFIFKGPLLNFKGIKASDVASSMIDTAFETSPGFHVHLSGDMQPKR